MNKVRAFDSAYPGSMSEREDGDYLRRDDPASLVAALLERDREQTRRIEDLEAALSQKPPQRVGTPDLLQRLLDAAQAVLEHRYQMGAPMNSEYSELSIAVTAALGVRGTSDLKCPDDEAFRQFQRDRIAEAQRHDAEQAKPKLTDVVPGCECIRPMTPVGKTCLRCGGIAAGAQGTSAPPSRPFGAVKVCPMNDAACEEIPAARRCSGCASSLVLKSTDGVQGTTPRRVIFCAGPHHEACPECVKAGRCAIAEAEGKDGVMGTLPEPVAWQYRRLYTGDDPGWGLWQPCTKDEADRLRGREDVQVRDLFTHGVRASRPLGCALAMRVMQSDLYQQLDGAERADCDELVQQNLEWFKRDRTAGVGMPREGQQ